MPDDWELKPQYKELLKLAEKIDDTTEGDEVSAALDELVIDVKLGEAAAINNTGYVHQLRFLCDHECHWETKDALEQLQKDIAAAKEDD